MKDNRRFFFLLIDDSPLDTFINSRFLTLEGLAEKVLSFNTSEDAIHFLSTTEPEDDYTYVMLIDLQMPGMNGFEILEEVDAKYTNWASRTRVFMVSSSVDPGDIARAEKTRILIQILEKPLNIARLMQYL